MPENIDKEFIGKVNDAIDKLNFVIETEEMLSIPSDEDESNEINDSVFEVHEMNSKKLNETKNFIENNINDKSKIEATVEAIIAARDDELIDI